MKKSVLFSGLLFVAVLCFQTLSFAQSYNTNRNELANYLKRMYSAAPFEGVRIVEDYDNCYLISVVALENSRYKSESMMNRVAELKAKSEATRYFNGSTVDTDVVIRIREVDNNVVETEMIESIKERSAGYIREFELLTSTLTGDGKTVFFYSKRIELEKQKK